jgi:hypothetical protein
MDPKTCSETSRKSALATRSGLDWQGLEVGVGPFVIPRCAIAHLRARHRAKGGISCNYIGIPGSLALLAPRNDGGVKFLGSCPLVAHAQEFHRPVRDGDPEGCPDGAFHQMDVAAMGADQFGGDGEAKPAAAGPA